MPKRKDSKEGVKPTVKKAKAVVKAKVAKAAVKPKAAEVKSKARKLNDMLAPSEADYLKSRDDNVDKEDTIDIVSFYLSDSLFAVEVDYVGAVIMSREIVELPHTPDFIDGLISVRGEMILVMNLKRRLGIDMGASTGGNIIVTEPSSNGNETGMVVDRMAGVMEVAGLLKSPVKDSRGKKGGVPGKEHGFIKGIVESDDKGPINVLDMEKLMAFDMPAGVA